MPGARATQVTRASATRWKTKHYCLRGTVSKTLLIDVTAWAKQATLADDVKTGRKMARHRFAGYTAVISASPTETKHALTPRAVFPV
ncbi:hypothetical protein Ade02nite_87440 [Paractinoplanes deccanensis]|uniref:Uncharacterized protein n=1 Tax=Paractinoplanes deccanensis TaxID=113561 RepID=A0ABQ3YJD2_9ACTN|nr:hypothetical protein [Actinoplanes deccanensis]GID80103.1 hypothetical protein Ade02nite_87440 [Actinoplanes deccanensis]